MVEEGGEEKRERIEKRIREKSVFIWNIERERERKREIERDRKRKSLHLKLRKRIDLSDGLTSGTIARFSRRVSPNNHLMSHNISMF